MGENEVDFRDLLFRIMDKQDACDIIIRELSVQSESNVQAIKAVKSKCVVLHNLEDSGSSHILPGKKDAVRIFKGMTGKQRFILLLVWGIVTAIGLLAFILINIDKLK